MEYEGRGEQLVRGRAEQTERSEKLADERRMTE